jgi:hypothetical protein
MWLRGGFVLFCGTFIVSSSLEQITKCDYNSISLTDKDNRGKDSAKKKRRDVSILNSILLPNEDGRNADLLRNQEESDSR